MHRRRFWCWCVLTSALLACTLSSNDAAAWGPDFAFGGTATTCVSGHKFGTFYRCPQSTCGICYCRKKGAPLPPDPCKAGGTIRLGTTAGKSKPAVQDRNRRQARGGYQADPARRCAMLRRATETSRRITKTNRRITKTSNRRQRSAQPRRRTLRHQPPRRTRLHPGMCWCPELATRGGQKRFLASTPPRRFN